MLMETGDVSKAADRENLHREVSDRFGVPQLLINNAGMMRRPGSWAPPEAWREVLDVNFTSALRLQHLFVPDMIAADQPGAIVNLGSKEGITTPPGQAAEDMILGRPPLSRWHPDFKEDFAQWMKS